MGIDNCISRVMKESGLGEDDAIAIMDEVLEVESKIGQQHTGKDRDMMLQRAAIKRGGF